MADDTFYYPSSGEETYFEKLRHLIAKHPHDIRHYLDLFPVYTSRRAFIRLLAHYELFKRTIDLPGHYVDFESTSENPSSAGISFWRFLRLQPRTKKS